MKSKLLRVSVFFILLFHMDLENFPLKTLIKTNSFLFSVLYSLFLYLYQLSSMLTRFCSIITYC